MGIFTTCLGPDSRVITPYLTQYSLTIEQSPKTNRSQILSLLLGVEEMCSAVGVRKGFPVSVTLGMW